MPTGMTMLLRKPKSVSGEHWVLCLIPLPPQVHLLQIRVAFGRRPQKRRITDAVTETVQTVLHTMGTVTADGIMVTDTSMDVSVVATVVRRESVTETKPNYIHKALAERQGLFQYVSQKYHCVTKKSF